METRKGRLKKKEKLIEVANIIDKNEDRKWFYGIHYAKKDEKLSYYFLLWSEIERLKVTH